MRADKVGRAVRRNTLENSPTIKVVHIIAGPISGGAAKGALSLHYALREKGIDSKVINNAGGHELNTDIIRVSSTGFTAIKSNFLWLASRLALLLYPKRQKVIFNLGIEGVPFKNIDAFKRADIVHYHWINSLASISQVGYSNKPAVWTLRDMWPFTGGCHYSMDCRKYESGCGACPVLGSRRSADITAKVIESKRKRIPQNIKIVGVSSWLSAAAQKSRVFDGFDVRTIHNAIDTVKFSPLDKSKAKKQLGIPTNKTLILSGATNLNEFYKGLEIYLKAIPRVESPDVLFGFFGKLDKASLEGLSPEWIDFGFISDVENLRQLYSAADAVVVPSRMDAFPKTIIEAMACGTPVICFNTSSFSEIVRHRETGYVAKAFDFLDLRDGIEWVCKLSKEESDRVSSRAREIAVREFDVSVAAQNYINLYRELLD